MNLAFAILQLRRLLQLNQIKEKLQCLDSGHFVVIHGMPGSGKSVLAAEAVRDPEITLKVRTQNCEDNSFLFKLIHEPRNRESERVNIFPLLLLLPRSTFPMAFSGSAWECWTTKSCSRDSRSCAISSRRPPSPPPSNTPRKSCEGKTTTN